MAGWKIIKKKRNKAGKGTDAHDPGWVLALEGFVGSSDCAVYCIMHHMTFGVTLNVDFFDRYKKSLRSLLKMNQNREESSLVC